MRGQSVLLLCLLLAACTPAVVREEGSVRVVMCPECKTEFQAYLRGGGNISCALYDVGSEVAALLALAHADVVTDDETNSAYGVPYVHAGLMHDKFCIVNGSTVLTGSYNPTDKGELNKNNLLIIHSKTLAENYRKELASMQTKQPRPSIPHTVILSNVTIENYFCPADNCEEHVLEALEQAQYEILYMTYSFTSDPIGDVLLRKQAQDVRVEGVCEEQQIQQYSECTVLGSAVWDRDVLLHHKVFIIDEKTVVTGSYNPTASGDRRNRENILIIHDAAVAAQFREEYTRIQQALNS